MKEFMKRGLALLLALAMVFGMMPQIAQHVHAASGSFTLANGTLGVSYSGGNSADKGGKTNETSAWFQAWASGLKRGSTNTIKLTNNSGSKAILTFDYSITGDCSACSLGKTSGSGSYNSGEIENGTTITITLTGKGGWTGGTEPQLTLTNVALTVVKEDPTVTVNFDSAMGVVTVGGTAVTAGHSQQVATGGSITLKATANSGYTFHGWVDGEGNTLSKSAEFTLSPVADMTVKPFFSESNKPIFGVGDKTSHTYWDGVNLGITKLGTEVTYYKVTPTVLFDDLNEAAAYAKSSGKGNVVLMNSGTLPAGTYTIPSGVTLLIPFDDENTLYTNMAVSTSDGTTPYAYRTLTLAEGANLVINGAMSLSAKQRYAAGGNTGGYPAGAVSFVNMAPGSSIQVNGSLYAYGYITGGGTVTANDGSKVYEMFQIMDFRGGTASTNMENRVFPISQYYIQNIEVPLTIYEGATEYAVTTIYMSNAAFTTSVAFIGKSGCMFNLTDGYVVKTYDGSTDRLILESNGSFEVESAIMDVGGTKLNSSEYVLAINSNMTLNVNNGSITLKQDLALLPGVILNVADGVTCSLGEGVSVYVYDADDWGAYCFRETNHKFIATPYAPSRTYTRTEADLVDAKITIAGTVDASLGYLYTTAGGADVRGEGTGKIILNPEVPNTITYQATQDNTTVSYVEIPVTSAKLRNNNALYPTFTETAEATDTTYYWRSKCNIWHTDNTAVSDHVNAVLDHVCDLCGGDVGIACFDDPTDGDHNCDYCGKEAITECADKNKDHTCINDTACTVYSTGDNAHKDDNYDHVCDYGCSVAIGTCEDTDYDHKCDYGCTKTYGTHADGDKDHACDYGCKETIGTCEDKDLDHACDYGCTKTHGTHADGDKDHACDYGCKEAIGTHADENSDHICDYGCKEAIGTCEDKDFDHDCDYGCDQVYGTCEDTDKDHKCDYGCDETYGDHVDGNYDHACDYGCSVAIGTCEDKNLDHACDYGCDKVYGTCEDTDKDHKCDYGCDETYGDHVDGNYDHACDYGCKEAMGTCEDKDFDHDCDYGCDQVYGEHEDSSEDGDHVCDYGCNEVLEKCEDCAWDYTNNGNGTHDAVCSICGKQMLDDANHVYDENGLCFCENTAEAVIGGTYYYTFLEAIAAAEDGETVTLLKSVTLTQAITVSNKAITIKAEDGAVITTSVVDVFTVTSGGTLTLGEGLVVSSTTSILYANGGTIHVDGAILTATGSAYAVAFADASGVIHVISGEINAVDCVGVTVSASGATVNISGGTVTSNSSSAVVAKDNGVVNISGGEVKTTAKDAYCAAFARNGVVNVTGGTVSSANGYGLVAVSDGTVTVSGGTVNGGVLAHENANANATISGGVINGHVGVNNGASMTVTGGSFTMDVTEYCDAHHHTIKSGDYYVYGKHTDCDWNYNDNENGTHDAYCMGCRVQMLDDAKHVYEDGYCPCGNTAEAVIGGTYYYTFLEAIAAAKDGETVTLLKSVTLTQAITVSDKSVIITAANDAVITTSVVDVFTVTSGGTLTLGEGLVVSSTTSILYANGGTIYVDGAILTATGSAYAVAYADDSGVINVISGAINAVDCVGVTVSASGATVNISGGTVTSNSSSAVVAKDNGVVNISGGEVKTTAKDAYCAAFARNGVVNVTGGTVSSANGYGLVAVSDGTVTVSGGTLNGGVLAHENANANATISGGVINGHVGVNNGASMTVTGGSFTMNVTEYCGYMYHTVKPEDGEYYVYGEHVYVNGLCACGHVQDLDVSVIIKAEGQDASTNVTGTIKYGTTYEGILDFTVFGDCYKWDSFTVTVDGKDVPYSYENDVLVVDGEYVTGHIEIVVTAVQRHTVGAVVMENYIAPSFDTNGSYDVVAYCADCGVVIRTEHYVIEGSQLTAVAQIGDTRYETLDEAIAAANAGDTIVLLQQVAVEGSKVWDLTGITLQIADAGYNYGLIVRGELTINGGNFVVNGMYGIGVTATGSLTINGGYFGYNDANDYLIGSYGTTVINGGTFNGQYSCANSFAGDLTINGGSFTTTEYDCTGEYASSDLSVSVNSGATLTINGGSFSKTVVYTDGDDHALTDHLAEGYCLAEADGRYTVAQHVAGETVTENVKDATCTAEGSYDLVTYCVHCGEEMSRETVSTPVIPHTEGEVEFSWNILTNVGSAYWTCVDCGTAFDIETQTTSAFVEGNCVTRNKTIYTATAIHNNTVYTSTYVVNGAYGDHLAGEAKVENVIDATCTTEGSYDNVTYCVHCGEEMSRETVSAPVIPHTEGKVEFHWNILTNEGTAYWTCVDCGTRFDIETQTTSAFVEGNCVTRNQTIYTATAIHNNTVYTSTYVVNGAYGDHLAGEVKVENVVDATCTTEGSYDNVTYCVHCGEKMSRETVSVEKLAHTASKVEKENSKAPTCTESGSYENVTYCACGEELSREVITVSATGHTVGSVVTDKYVAPTCTEAGSYDMVLYCGTCKAEISRTSTTVAATGHKHVLNIVAPTCTEKGLKNYVCACGDSYAEDIPAAGHSYEKVVTAPTCTETGYTTCTCSVCGDSYNTDYVNAAGHSYATVVTDPTCSAKGYTTYTCTVCADTYVGDYVDAKGHNYTSAVTEPTCVASGYTTHTCTVCNHSYKDNYVNALGHKHETTIIVEATCEKTGLKELKCTVCGDVQSAEIPATGHSYEEIVTEPTCTVSGSVVYYCDACGDRYLEIIPATGHSFETVVTAPTCTEKGYTTYTCACGYSYKADEVEVIEHSWVAGEVTAPTCTEAGYTTYTCSECGQIHKADEIAAAGHTIGKIVTENYKAATCTEAGSYDMVIYCATCNIEIARAEEVVEATGHSYVVTVHAPTCTEGGYTTYTCACGHSYVDDKTDALDHSYTGVTTAPTCTEDGYTTYTCDACGYSYVDDKTEALGHTEGKVVKEYAEDGSYYDEVVYCSECGKELSRTKVEIVDDKYLLGDVNFDGEVDIKDANLIASYYNELVELNEAQLIAADVNGDGEIDIKDANLIASYYNELVEGFPAEQ